MLTKPNIQDHLLQKLPMEVRNIFAIFGSEIRLVGGAVRDLLLDSKVHDFDFATTYQPLEVKKILIANNIKYVDLAEKFGTIIAIINGNNYEITTLRREYEYDGRHCQVEFSCDFLEDAKRRDFTINALYMDMNGKIYDYFSGLTDLKKKNLQFIGVSQQRISEDYLRILRFFRFSVRFSSKLNQENLESCIYLQNNLKKLSKPRIRDEFLKIIANSNISSDRKKFSEALEVMQNKGFFITLFETNLHLKRFFNLLELSKKLDLTVSQNLKIAALFIDDKIELGKLKNNLCLTKKEFKYLKFCKDNYDVERNSDEFLEIMANQDHDLIQDFYLFLQMRLDVEINMDKLKQTLDFFKEYMVANFPIKGADILQLDLENQDSPEHIGFALKKCKVAWIKSGFKMTKQELINMIDQIKSK